MRITGGIYKARAVQTVKGQEVRPTSSKVRESIFNIIQLNEFGTVFYENETIVLDLFAGSGIIGLEALSRGAKKAVFVEKNAAHTNIIKTNINNICSSEQKNNISVINTDAVKILDKIDEKFNFIFVDPPYKSELYEPVLKKIKEKEILMKEGFVILEHSASIKLEKIIELAEFKIYKTKTYGDTSITVVTR